MRGPIVTVSLGSIIAGVFFGGFFLLALIVGIVQLIIQGVPQVTWWGWLIIGGIAAVVILVCVWYRRLPGDETLDESDRVPRHRDGSVCYCTLADPDPRYHAVGTSTLDGL